jgi:hypothetical protein
MESQWHFFYISFMTEDVEHFFLYLLLIWTFSLRTVYFVHFEHIFIEELFVLFSFHMSFWSVFFFLFMWIMPLEFWWWLHWFCRSFPIIQLFSQHWFCQPMNIGGFVIF